MCICVNQGEKLRVRWADRERTEEGDLGTFCYSWFTGHFLCNRGCLYCWIGNQTEVKAIYEDFKA